VGGQRILSLGFDIGSQRQDPLAAHTRPAHAATAQPGFDQRLAGGLHRSIADGQAATPKRGIGHSAPIAAKKRALLRQGVLSGFPQSLSVTIVIQRTKNGCGSVILFQQFNAVLVIPALGAATMPLLICDHTECSFLPKSLSILDLEYIEGSFKL